MPLIFSLLGIAQIYQWINLTTLMSYLIAALYVGLSMRELKRPPSLNTIIANETRDFKKEVLKLADSERDVNNELLLLNKKYQQL